MDDATQAIIDDGSTASAASKQNKELQEDSDNSLQFQQAAKEEHMRSEASLLLILRSEQEEMRQKFVTLMAENEKMVRDKLECFERERRLEDLRGEAQVRLAVEASQVFALAVEASEVFASPASPCFCSCCPLLNLAFRCVCVFVCVCARVRCMVRASVRGEHVDAHE
jgi:hypothetical protein